MKNVALLTEDGAFALFFRPRPPPPPTGVWQLKSPHPREFAIQGKKMLIPRDQPGGVGLGAGGIDWCISSAGVKIGVWINSVGLNSN